MSLQHLPWPDLFAHSLRTAGEVRDAQEAFHNISDAGPDPVMIAIAKQIIKPQEGPFAHWKTSTTPPRRGFA